MLSFELHAITTAGTSANTETIARERTNEEYDLAREQQVWTTPLVRRHCRSEVGGHLWVSLRHRPAGGAMTTSEGHR